MLQVIPAGAPVLLFHRMKTCRLMAFTLLVSLAACSSRKDPSVLWGIDTEHRMWIRAPGNAEWVTVFDGQNDCNDQLNLRVALKRRGDLSEAGLLPGHRVECQPKEPVVCTVYGRSGDPIGDFSLHGDQQYEVFSSRNVVLIRIPGKDRELLYTIPEMEEPCPPPPPPPGPAADNAATTGAEEGAQKQ
jgi:hypothetical protein